eukprot:TRINITY_DN5915_c0_g1_i2.p1 TRINITY_DN5915_c0_g1~~TRINITY_DN5915_c0_g1_i2.p1  ORF type:complete len:677 (+),score=196.76 TRINITY_DN5915_c0_g1_i2:160-2190(+)
MRKEDDDTSSTTSNSIDLDDEHLSSHESSIDDHDIGESVQGLLDEIPIRFVVFKWVDQNDPFGWHIVAAQNAKTSDNSVIMPASDLIGKRVDVAYPGLKGNNDIFGMYKYVATTGNPSGFELEYPEGGVMMRFQLKFTPLPGNSVFVVYENLDEYRDIAAKQKETNEQMDALLEKAVDVMIHSQSEEDDQNVNLLSLKHLFNASDSSREAAQSKILVEEFEKKQKVISMADVETLVRNLSTTESKDNPYMRQFLTSYRYFMTSTALLNKLLVKYMTGRTKTGEERKNIEDKVFDVLKIWLSEHYYDFSSDPELLKTLQEFINNRIITSDRSPEGDSLNRIIAKQLQAEVMSQIRSPTDTVNHAKSKRTMRSTVNLLEEDPTEVAHQLTLLCFERFKSLKPIEFYAQSWSKENAHLIAPNILDMIKQFNKITNWVSAEILMRKDLKARISVVKQFIDIAWTTYGYRDFETTFAVQMGLEQQTISRLSDTWKNLDQSTKQKWLALHEFTSYKRNYKNYRKKVNEIISSQLGSNLIPYFSLYLKDLTILEENTSITQVGAVNFHKMRKVANIIAEIQKAQKSLFAFQKNVKILVYLTTEIPHLDDEAQWKMSKICEPESSGLDPADLCASTSYSAMSPGSIFRAVKANASPEVLVQKVSNPIFGVKLPQMAIRRTPSRG